jgi:YfiH family protein
LILAASRPGIEIRFAGRRAGSEKGAPLDVLARSVAGEAPPLAWAKQVHSAEVLPADHAGSCGEGDALVTTRLDGALGVVTADCVPVLLAAGHGIGGGAGIAAVHAGWRGLASGVVAAAVARLRSAQPSPDIEAWIGPSIGPCCYEVSDDVARAVVAASGDQALAGIDASGKPHLDLFAAARESLRAVGVERVATFSLCTRCHADLWWSHRRESATGGVAGRNLAMIWRSPQGSASVASATT